jgi:hypothetical protein
MIVELYLFIFFSLLELDLTANRLSSLSPNIRFLNRLTGINLSVSRRKDGGGEEGGGRRDRREKRREKAVGGKE